MKLVTYHVPDRVSRLGLWEGDLVYPLTTFASFADLLEAAHAAGTTPLALVQEAAPAARQGASIRYTDLDRVPDPALPHLLKPLEPVEVWASGVTYLRSRDAREAESHGATIYDRIYEAERPELFFKATGARTVGPNHPVGIRSDSAWQVPEPELGLVLGVGGHLVGLTVGNDQTCRDVEAHNPLYLPQAKIFKYSCALGPAVLLANEQGEPMVIRLRVSRSGKEVVAGETSTSQLVRPFAQLIDYLLRDNDYFSPTVLLTGTGIIPPDDFTLQAGDMVEVEIEGIGKLRNPVISVN